MNRHSPTSELVPKIIKNRGQSRLRVRYCECDPMGVAHHSSYVAWLEIGRTELLRDCGVTYAQMEESGTFLVIVKLDLRYRRPVKYDDLVEVRTHWIGGSRIKIEHSYEVVVVERGGGRLRNWPRRGARRWRAWMGRGRCVSCRNGW